MALMTEERRKEMEEEMSRFELEIAAPGGMKSSGSNGMTVGNKPLSPPPPPPAVAALIPEVLVKAPPPPPPPPSSPPPALHAVLRPPPPPPPTIQARPQTGPMRFIPPQLQRHPPRPPMRHSFVPMRGLPMGGPPGHYPSHTPMGPFGPPMGQTHPVGPQMHGSPMPHMPPGPMQMPPAGMPMPPQMGNMSLPMPPGFCPPSGPAPPMMASGGNLPCEPQAFMSSDRTQNFDLAPPASVPMSSSETVVAAPAVYAAPFVKSHADSALDSLMTNNGQENLMMSSGTINTPKSEKQTSVRTEEHTVGPTVPSVTSNEETVVSKKKEKKKKTVRMAGGQAWEDNSLLEWEPDDFRIFCGDLGNDVTDEVLNRAFSKYPSFVKSKVIRDKRTNKTKGYGFVSFKDPQDFIKAMREMNGKYVGSRPIKLRKSTWKDRNIDIVKKKQREKEKLGLL